MSDAKVLEHPAKSSTLRTSHYVTIGVGLALLHLVGTASYTWAAYSPLPWGDSWEYWLRIAKDGGKMTLDHLWSRHNEHRIVIARLLFEIDRHLFAGTSTFLEGFNVFAPLLTAWVFWRCIANEQSAALRGLLLGSIFACVYAPAQFTNFTWSFQNQFLLVHSFSFLGFHLFRLSVTKSPSSVAFLAGSLLAGVAASLCMSGGLFFWPVIFLHALLARCSWCRVIAIGLFSGLVWAAYFFHYSVPGAPLPIIEGLIQFPKSVLFFFTLLGAPVSNLSDFILGHLGVPAAGWIYACSLFGFLFVLVAIVDWIKSVLQARETPPGGELTLCCIIVFLMVSGAAMALGRAPGFGISEALASRYATPAWYFTAAVILLATGVSRSPDNAATAGHKKYLLIFILLVATSSIFLPAYFFKGLAQAKYYASTDNAVMAQVQDEEALSRANIEPEKMIKVIPFLRSSHSSVFAARFHAPNFKESSVQSEADGKLPGFVEISKTIAGADAFLLRGWTSAGPGQGRVEKVFAVNKDNEVVGWSLMFYCRRELSWKTVDNPLKLNGWEFYVTNVKSHESVRLFGLCRGRDQAFAVTTLEMP